MFLRFATTLTQSHGLLTALHILLSSKNATTYRIFLMYRVESGDLSRSDIFDDLKFRMRRTSVFLVSMIFLLFVSMYRDERAILESILPKSQELTPGPGLPAGP